jgi:uncharacterized protein YndB with AHSA1/START domain
MTDIVATAEVEIAASAERVWEALTDPDQIRQYMFGSLVSTDWKVGSPITWKGEYNGQAYEDKGEILQIEPQRLLILTHFSPMSGQADVPENYHTLTYELASHDDRTHLSLSQDHNASEEEASHSRDNWQAMLAGLKEVAERR